MTLYVCPGGCRSAVLAGALWALAPLGIRAQAPAQPAPMPTLEEISRICGPRIPAGAGGLAATIAQHRDELNRGMYGPGDTVILDRGSQQGLRVGEQYLVRRAYPLDGIGSVYGRSGGGIHTAGWVQIVDLDPDFAIAKVIYACTEFQAGDRLEPYEPAQALDPSAGTKPDFGDAARVLSGDEGRTVGGPVQDVVVDRGSANGWRPGQRVTFFRRSFGATGPVSHVGEGYVTSVRPSSATVRIVHGRDAVYAGDLVAPWK